jgi:hypothetical protein
MKYWCFFVIFFLLPACGDKSSNNQISSPHSELLQLNLHSVNDIFKLKNESLWIIVGISSNTGTLNQEENDITIYNNPNDFGEPDQGIRGQYYVFINNSSDSFYIDPLPTPLLLTEGSVELARLSVGNVAVLGDDSVWMVTGVDFAELSDTNNNSFSSSLNYTVYSIKEDFPNLLPQITEDFGELSKWYLYNEEAPFGYYLEPIVEAQIIWTDVYTFNAEGVNDSILLSDGSLWLITGSLYTEYIPEENPIGEYSIKLIQDINLLEEPILGDKAETIMYVQGHETAFYVKEI